MFGCSSTPGQYRERLTGHCGLCFRARRPCPHCPELPLRLLLLGHNPSELAFRTGYAYGNPSNAMMRLLRGNKPRSPLPETGVGDTAAKGADTADSSVGEASATPTTFPAGTASPPRSLPKTAGWPGLIPPWWGLEQQADMPLATGVGFLDVRPDPGSNASDVAIEASHVRSLFQRLRLHAERCAALQGDAALWEDALALARARSAGLRAHGFAVTDVDQPFCAAGAGTATTRGTAPELAVSATAASASNTPRPNRTAPTPGDAAHGVAVARVKRGALEASLVAGASSKRAASFGVVTTANVAFTGMRQFELVFHSPVLAKARIRRLMAANGDSSADSAEWLSVNDRIPRRLWPPDWPLPPTTKVWVLVSSSGRASAFAGRCRAQYAHIASIVRALPWPPEPAST